MTNTETNPNDEAQKAADWEALVISSFELGDCFFLWHSSFVIRMK
jgi:hypothetical protein